MMISETERLHNNCYDTEEFYAGLAFAQSLPGPLFNFSAFLGGAFRGWAGAVVGWVALFSPGVLLILGFAPFWLHLRQNQTFKAFLKGVNAAAIGLVCAACVLMWEATIETGADAVVALCTGCFVLFLKLPPPLDKFQAPIG